MKSFFSFSLVVALFGAAFVGCAEDKRSLWGQSQLDAQKSSCQAELAVAIPNQNAAVTAICSCWIEDLSYSYSPADLQSPSENEDADLKSRLAKCGEQNGVTGFLNAFKWIKRFLKAQASTPTRGLAEHSELLPGLKKTLRKVNPENAKINGKPVLLTEAERTDLTTVSIVPIDMSAEKNGSTVAVNFDVRDQLGNVTSSFKVEGKFAPGEKKAALKSDDGKVLVDIECADTLCNAFTMTVRQFDGLTTYKRRELNINMTGEFFDIPTGTKGEDELKVIDNLNRQGLGVKKSMILTERNEKPYSYYVSVEREERENGQIDGKVIKTENGAINGYFGADGKAVISTLSTEKGLTSFSRVPTRINATYTKGERGEGVNLQYKNESGSGSRSYTHLFPSK